MMGGRRLQYNINRRARALLSDNKCRLLRGVTSATQDFATSGKAGGSIMAGNDIRMGVGAAQRRGAMRLAAGMMVALVVTAGAMLATIPGESAAQSRGGVCQMQMSGPLAGTCLRR